MAENFLSCQPEEYYQRFIDHDIRPDGRKLDEYRPINIGIGSIKTADGSAVLKIGKTTVVCGIRAQLTDPPILKPNEGYLVITVDIPGISRGVSKFASEEAKTLNQTVQEMVNNSKMFDVKSLNIEPSKLSWALFCDVIVCNNDGNALDACMLALVGALKNTQLPNVTVEEDNPIPIVNSAIKNNLVLNPNAEEEQLSSGMSIVCTLGKGTMCYMSSVGAGVEGSRKVELFELAKTHADKIRRQLVISCERNIVLVIQ